MRAHTLPRWHLLLPQTVQRSCPTYPNLQVTNSCSCSLFNWGHYTVCTAWLVVFSSLTSWVLAGFESPVLCCGGHVGLRPSHNYQYHHSGLTGLSRLVSHSGECSVLIQVPLHRMCGLGGCFLKLNRCSHCGCLLSESHRIKREASFHIIDMEKWMVCWWYWYEMQKMKKRPL